LLDRIASIESTLASQADETENIRTLAPASVAALSDMGLFAALAPREVGGHQVDPIGEMELIEAIARIDASTAWSFMIGAGNAARIASIAPPAALADMFEQGCPFPRVAYQVLSGGNKATSVDGGFRLRGGTWKFATGIRHADWVVAPVVVGSDLEVACALDANEVTVLDDWNPSGLIGTGTFSFRIEDAFVPAHRAWAHPGAQVRGGPYFLFKRAPIKHIGFALGVADGSLRGLSRVLALRLSPDGGTSHMICADLGRASVELEAARSLSRTVIADVWGEARAAGAVSDHSQKRLRAAAVVATEVALRVTRLVVTRGGASTLGRNHPLQRSLRDMSAAAAHAEVRLDAYADFGESLFRVGV